jgi:hypothetical protein
MQSSGHDPSLLAWLNRISIIVYDLADAIFGINVISSCTALGNKDIVFFKSIAIHDWNLPCSLHLLSLKLIQRLRSGSDHCRTPTIQVLFL